MRNGYIQLGYITNDFDAAIAVFRESHGIGPFKEMRNLTIGARQDLTVSAHFALAFVNGTQIEIIAPYDGDQAFYADALVNTSDFAIRLHHTGRYFPNSADYHAALDAARKTWDIPVAHDIFGGHYAYADARPALGHYLEFYSFPPEEHFDGVPVY